MAVLAPMPDYTSALLSRQVALLYRNVTLAQSISLINAALLAVVNGRSAGLTATLLWLGCASLLAGGRMWFGLRFRSHAAAHPPEFWFKHALLGAALAGLIWSTGAYTFMLGAPDQLQFFTAFVMAGMVAGAVPVLSSHRLVFRAYAWPIVSSVALLSLSDGNSFLHLAFGGMAILFLFGISRSADNFNSTLLETLRLELEKEVLVNDLEQARLAAEHVSQAKSNFLATISHELRTPLNGVLGMSDVLATTELSGEQREYLNVVKDSGNNLLAIINDILDMTQIESGNVALQMEAFPLKDLLASVTIAAERQARAKGIEFSCTVAPAVPLVLIGDEKRLHQILGKLLDNAVKFTASGFVRVSVGWQGSFPDGEQLEFIVADSGIGIAGDKLASIFQPFGQADASITRRFGGVGLGLPICRRLAALMGGELTVHSQLGQGSVFRLGVRLPKPAATD